ncbi:unnamed protein product, partial [Ostreobium quekettii]
GRLAEVGHESEGRPPCGEPRRGQEADVRRAAGWTGGWRAGGAAIGGNDGKVAALERAVDELQSSCVKLRASQAGLEDDVGSMRASLASILVRCRMLEFEHRRSMEVRIPQCDVAVQYASACVFMFLPHMTWSLV